MKFPLVIVFLVLVPGNILGKYVNFKDDLTYDDLVQTNVTCAYSETCKNGDPSQKRTCSCDSDCSVFGTCCIDSPGRSSAAPVVECRNVDPSQSRTGFLLASRCPPEVGEDSVWKGLCEKEWDGEDDVMKLAPVTSLDTLRAYKNYYCFRCHEDTDEFVGWDLLIQSSSSVDRNRVSKDDFSVTYDREKQRWIATSGGDGYVLDNVHFDFLVPGKLSVSPEVCKPDLVSGCDDAWKDEDTREKCGAYTAIVYSQMHYFLTFKNPHCALCNFEQVEDIVCELGGFIAFAPKRFSFAHLLDIHREDADESEKCGENQLWDPYGKKCRRIACAIPGYVVREGRCTRP